jgi:hypothetical protein
LSYSLANSSCYHDGEFRDREKVVRDIKKSNSSLIGDYYMCHNYFIQYVAFGGKRQPKLAVSKLKEQQKANGNSGCKLMTKK